MEHKRSENGEESGKTEKQERERAEKETENRKVITY